MKIGARNKLSGKIVDIKKGTLMIQVKLEVQPGVFMSSVMTTDSFEDLDLKVGDQASIVVKAVNVLLIRE
jgi:molybdate transport system regulatory protein